MEGIIKKMDPNLLTCYESPYPKKRIGRDNDGGYIISCLPDVKYDCLLAGGVADDFSFEEDFCKIYPETICFMFDGTISPLSVGPDINIKFISKNIGPNDNKTTTNLKEYIQTYENIFVKMDIEGAEIDWISSLSSEELDKFTQIVMEFHYPYSEREIPVFEKLNKTHLLVHFHGNNCCGIRWHNNVIMPNVFECTFVNKRFLPTPYKLNKQPIPSDLDMTNLNDREEIVLHHPPFYHP